MEDYEVPNKLLVKIPDTSCQVSHVAFAALSTASMLMLVPAGRAILSGDRPSCLSVIVENLRLCIILLTVAPIIDLQVELQH